MNFKIIILSLLICVSLVYSCTEFKNCIECNNEAKCVWVSLKNKKDICIDSKDYKAYKVRSSYVDVRDCELFELQVARREKLANPGIQPEKTNTTLLYKLRGTGNYTTEIPVFSTLETEILSTLTPLTTTIETTVPVTSKPIIPIPEKFNISLVESLRNISNSNGADVSGLEKPIETTTPVTLRLITQPVKLNALVESMSETLTSKTPVFPVLEITTTVIPFKSTLLPTEIKNPPTTTTIKPTTPLALTSTLGSFRLNDSFEKTPQLYASLRANMQPIKVHNSGAVIVSCLDLGPQEKLFQSIQRSQCRSLNLVKRFLRKYKSVEVHQWLKMNPMSQQNHECRKLEFQRKACAN